MRVRRHVSPTGCDAAREVLWRVGYKGSTRPCTLKGKASDLKLEKEKQINKSACVYVYGVYGAWRVLWRGSVRFLLLGGSKWQMIMYLQAKGKISCKLLMDQNAHVIIYFILKDAWFYSMVDTDGRGCHSCFINCRNVQYFEASHTRQQTAFPMPTKCAISYTGGKDSTLALHRVLAHADEHEVVLLVTFVPANMTRFRAHPVHVVEMQAQAMGLPHQRLEVGGSDYLAGYRRHMEWLKREWGVEVLVTGE